MRQAINRADPEDTTLDPLRDRTTKDAILWRSGIGEMIADFDLGRLEGLLEALYDALSATLSWG